MKIAILGGGFCGVAVAYLLREKNAAVTLFDPGGIGGGASGIASGLLHAYPGEKARLSEDGKLALEKAKALLDAAGPHTYVQEGIERYPVSEEQKEEFAKRAAEDPSLYFDGETLLFKEGITVFAMPYLKSLFAASGAHFEKRALAESDFDTYDKVIVCVGSAVTSFSFGKTLPVRMIKGQVLHCDRPSFLTRSVIAKGYIATVEDPSMCIVGSTYEHHFTSAAPDMEEAKRQILPRITKFLPHKTGFNVRECKSGVRVAHIHNYLPIIVNVSPRVVVLTGMGSRGLLYHALYAEKVVDML